MRPGQPDARPKGRGGTDRRADLSWPRNVGYALPVARRDGADLNLQLAGA